MCLKTAPLTKPSASELPFPSVAPTLCQDAGRSYSLSAYPGQCHCEQCLQQKGKKKGRWPNLSFHFHQTLGSEPANMTATQPSLSMSNPKKRVQTPWIHLSSQTPLLRSPFLPGKVQVIDFKRLTPPSTPSIHHLPTS